MKHKKGKNINQKSFFLKTIYKESSFQYKDLSKTARGHLRHIGSFGQLMKLKEG
jgi:hypothetical protein